MKTIVFCIPNGGGRQFSGYFVEGLCKTLFSCRDKGVNPILRRAESPNVYDVRNVCLMGYRNIKNGQKQKPFKGEWDYDYVMWLDSDQVWQVEDFWMLFDRIDNDNDLHILSGWYLKERTAISNSPTNMEINPDDAETTSAILPGGDFEKTHFLTKGEVKQQIEDIINVDFTGFGFTLVRRGVFEAVGYPWFRPLGMENPDNGELLDFTGEDAGFCALAKMRGYTTYVMTKCQVGHEKMKIMK